MNLDAINFSFIFSFECDSMKTVACIHKTCLNEQYNEAMNYGQGFVRLARVCAEKGKYGDLGTITNQYDELKVSNVHQYIALMDVVTLKLCAQINVLLIKLVATPNTRKYVDRIMESACFIVGHHKEIRLYVLNNQRETFPNAQEARKGEQVADRILCVTYHSLQRSLNKFPDVMEAHGLTDKLKTILKYMGDGKIYKKELDFGQWEAEHDFALDKNIVFTVE